MKAGRVRKDASGDSEDGEDDRITEQLFFYVDVNTTE